ncbi:unnamed protein product [Prorocentrum cordatum]|uniref:Uncharacterized protein n=1 Tax=Prorocentrum cordatum TaxID=2364126 RepID=A0ABN9RUD1_9DINO|nr:unnamed protein product [Polarella glacialis]
MDWSRLEVADVGHAAGLWQAAGFWALVFLTIWLGVFAAMVACGVQEIGGQRRATWGVKVICITHHLLTGPLALAALLQDPIVAKALTCLGCEEAAWSMARDTSLGPPPGVRALMPITLGYIPGGAPWGVLAPKEAREVRAGHRWWFEGGRGP